MPREELTFARFKDAIVWGTTTCVIIWLYILTTHVLTHVSEDKVKSMIDIDNRLIVQRLNTSDQWRGDMVGAIQDNTKAIQAMRIEVERLLIIKPAEVYQKVEDMDEKLGKVLDRISATSRGPPVAAPR